MTRTRHFHSKAAYERWLAYGHIHRLFERTPGHQRVYIRGKRHRVKHSKGDIGLMEIIIISLIVIGIMVYVLHVTTWGDIINAAKRVFHI